MQSQVQLWQGAVQSLGVLYHAPDLHLLLLLPQRTLRFGSESFIQPRDIRLWHSGRSSPPFRRPATVAASPPRPEPHSLRRGRRAGGRAGRPGRRQGERTTGRRHPRVKHVRYQKVSAGDYNRREEGRDPRPAGVSPHPPGRESGRRGAALLRQVLR